MNQIGLFAGIGGFELAAHWAGWNTIAWCEIDKKCQKLLKIRLPDARGIDDIKQFNFKQYANTIDIITGGFPCQPYSLAGKRKGKEDDRHLWPEMLRATAEIKPRWIVGENVYGIINWANGLVFEEIQNDLENQGYQVWAYILPASAVGAPHKRERVWIVAHNNKVGCKRNWPKINTDNTGQQTFNDIGKDITTNTNKTRCEKAKRKKEIGNIKTIKHNFSYQQSFWDGFPSFAPVCGGNDGIPNRLDRLQQLGNAIVPHIAYQIFKSINDYENNLIE